MKCLAHLNALSLRVIRFSKWVQIFWKIKICEKIIHDWFQYRASMLLFRNVSWCKLYIFFKYFLHEIINLIYFIIILTKITLSFKKNEITKADSVLSRFQYRKPNKNIFMKRTKISFWPTCVWITFNEKRIQKHPKGKKQKFDLLDLLKNPKLKIVKCLYNTWCVFVQKCSLN